MFFGACIIPKTIKWLFVAGLVPVAFSLKMIPYSIAGCRTDVWFMHPFMSFFMAIFFERIAREMTKKYSFSRILIIGILGGGLIFSLFIEGYQWVTNHWVAQKRCVDMGDVYAGIAGSLIRPSIFLLLFLARKIVRLKIKKEKQKLVNVQFTSFFI